MGLKMTITIDGAKHLDMGIWMAKLEPDEVATLGKCENRSVRFSVLLMDSEVDYDEKTQTLSFNPNATCLLNIGGTEQILVLSSKDKKPVSKPVAAPSDAVLKTIDEAQGRFNVHLRPIPNQLKQILRHRCWWVWGRRCPTCRQTIIDRR